jgi:hypothetical protein
MNGEFEEFGGLADRLKRADLSGESRVREPLRARLLARAERKERRVPAFAWLAPAFAAAALFVMFGPRPQRPAVPEAVTAAAAYALPDDGYGPCGRMGLEDYQAGERF